MGVPAIKLVEAIVNVGKQKKNMMKKRKTTKKRFVMKQKKKLNLCYLWYVIFIIWSLIIILCTFFVSTKLEDAVVAVISGVGCGAFSSLLVSLILKISENKRNEKASEAIFQTLVSKYKIQTIQLGNLIAQLCKYKPRNAVQELSERTIKEWLNILNTSPSSEEENFVYISELEEEFDNWKQNNYGAIYRSMRKIHYSLLELQNQLAILSIYDNEQTVSLINHINEQIFLLEELQRLFQHYWKNPNSKKVWKDIDYVGFNELVKEFFDIFSIFFFAQNTVLMFPTQNRKRNPK